MNELANRIVQIAKFRHGFLVDVPAKSQYITVLHLVSGNPDDWVEIGDGSAEVTKFVSVSEHDVLNGPFETVERTVEADVHRNAIAGMVDQLLEVVTVVGIVVDATKKLEGLCTLDNLS